jgi:mannose-6-phosphate isomerase
MQAECLTFQPLYMERVWGGRKLQTFFERALPESVPVGESWELVDREDAQSIVSEGEFRGVALHEIWTDHRQEVFGEGFDHVRFPILVKILDASDTLSLQVHPGLPGTTSSVAESKSEFWYFVGTDEGASIYVGLKHGVSRSDFETALATGKVLELLHRIPTQPDGFIYIPGGRLHAIDAGNVLFEIQQNSDTTYRVFDWNRLGLDGKPRQLHIESSLSCIDFDDFEPALSKGKVENLVVCDWFRIDRWILNQGREANPEAKFSIFQVVAGTVSFGVRFFQRGDLFLVPASSHKGSLIPHSVTATVLRTTL